MLQCEAMCADFVIGHLHAFDTALPTIRASRVGAGSRDTEVFKIATYPAKVCKSKSGNRLKEGAHRRIRHAPQAENCWRVDLGCAEERRYGTEAFLAVTEDEEEGRGDMVAEQGLRMREMDIKVGESTTGTDLGTTWIIMNGLSKKRTYFSSPAGRSYRVAKSNQEI